MENVSSRVVHAAWKVTGYKKKITLFCHLNVNFYETLLLLVRLHDQSSSGDEVGGL